MRPALSALTTTFATAVAAYAVDRLAEPLAIALTAFAHTLHPEAAKREMERRER